MKQSLIYEKLKQVAAARRTITYKDVGKVASLVPGPELFEILTEISEHEHKDGRPLLSVIVVGGKGIPGPGFFTLARRRGLLQQEESYEEFFHRELNKVHQVWTDSGTRRADSGLVAEAEGSAEDTARALWQDTELMLHEIVKTVLVKKDGDSWRETAVPEFTRMKYEKYPAHTPGIGELAKIIKHKWEWFSRYFDRKKVGKNLALEWMFKLKGVRIRFAYPTKLKSNPITSGDMALCQWCHEEARKILAAVEATSSAKVRS